LCARLQQGRRAIARALGMAESTVRWWCASVGKSARPLLGRPPLLANRLQRNDIIGAIRASNGRICVRELKLAYPGIGRAQLRSLLSRYRRLQRKARRRRLATLRWLQPGTVWAMDHTELHVEGNARHVLVVRDLASGKTLAAEPTPSMDAATTIEILRRLIAEHGAPLVIKCDNGSGFIAEETKSMLAASGVLLLYSPPGTPSYNGACEAGVGSIKHRAQDAAWHRGSVTAVSLDELLLAQSQADLERVERRSGAPTRHDVWCRRQRPAPALRDAMRVRVDHWRARARLDLGIAADKKLPHAEQASLDRFAIGQALRNLNLLTVTWRR